MKLRTGQKKLPFPPIGYKFMYLKEEYTIAGYDTKKIKFCIIAVSDSGKELYFQVDMFQHHPYNSWAENNNL